MRLNTPTRSAPKYTHQGALASGLTPIQELRRSVLSCMLWEDTFYESGQSIAERIARNAAIVKPEALANLAIEARQRFHLRHVPLLLLLELSKTAKGIPGLTRNTTEAVISRPDEMAELLAIYWRDGRKMIPHGIRKGLRQAAQNFDAFQLRKWNRDGAIKLRDVVFMAHIAFADSERAKLIANIVNKTFYPEGTSGGFSVRSALNLDGEPRLDTPDTWEAKLAACGSDKPQRKALWENLLNKALNREQGSIGYMALLRNLRNMAEDGVSHKLIEQAIEARVGARRVLPFRFIQAARITPQFFRPLDKALLATIQSQEPLSGITALCVDCSGSMQSPVSAKSQVTRHDAAAALAGCIPGNVRLIAFGEIARELQPVPGLGCGVALSGANVGHSTNAHLAVNLANKLNPDRIIVITDEQVTQRLPSPQAESAYVINVASYQNGVGYGDWTHIDGFSASALDYIREVERGASHSA
jgi:60 kDa SS-A/Ro ribonucleoprotein